MEATFEDKPDSREDAVKRWFAQIKLADKAEKCWRDDAEYALKTYRSYGVDPRDDGGEGPRKDVFNVLWANTEIKRYALYANLPAPDIRRRFGDPDPISKAVSEVLERCVTYTLDCQNVDASLVAATNDMLLPGRAVTRVRYKAHLSAPDEPENVQRDDNPEEAAETEAEAQSVEYEEVKAEQVQWDDLIRGPGKSWDEMPWLAFRHRLTKDEVEERFPDFSEKITYDVRSHEGEDTKRLDKTEETVYKRATIYEIWDKEDRKVKWLAKGYTDDFLEIDDDPLELKDFWPIPKPLYAVEDPASLIPQTEFSKYSALAKELEIVTRRVNRIADALRVRGVYDSRMGELEKVFQSSDNEFIPAEDLALILEAGGIDNAIWFLPIDMLVSAYQVLTRQRTELLGQIYEITGISDIIRGDTQASETATAQQLKANFGSMRLERQKQAVQKYARDLIRLMVEVIAEQFSRETISLMSGMDFPTMQDRVIAQNQAQMAQQRIQTLQSGGMGQPQNMGAMGMPQEQIQAQVQQLQQQIQQAQEFIQQPVWEEIEEVLHSDLLREYRVDIETDSTIAVDQQREQQNMTEFMNGMGQFTRYAGEAVDVGLLSPGAAKSMMVAFSRKFKLGREVESELEQMDPPQQNPEQAQAEQEAQMEQQKQQFELQKQEMENQKAQMEAQVDMREKQMEMRLKEQELQTKRLEMELDRQRLMFKDIYENAKHRREMEKLDQEEQKPEKPDSGSKPARQRFRYDSSNRTLSKADD